VFGPEASVVTSAVLVCGIIVLLVRGSFASFGVTATAAAAAKPAVAPGGATSTFGGSVPEHYDEILGPVLFAGYAADITGRAAALKPGSVLELAAGTGIVSRRLRDSLAPETSLLVSDLSPPMLAIAETKFKPGEMVEFHQADAMALPFEAASVDQIVCQFGAMYFPDKVAAYTEARRVLRDGGWLVFNVWGTLERNPCAKWPRRRWRISIPTTRPDSSASLTPIPIRARFAPSLKRPALPRSARTRSGSMPR
jgi:SAM-dependent methyltransferase